jgi:hypothetical protein
LLPENQSPGLNANSQFRNNKSWGFRKRKESLLIIRQRGGQGESASQSTVILLLRESVHLLKEHSGTQLDYMIRYMFTRATSLDSLGVWHHFSEAVCLGCQVYCSHGRRKGVENCLV